MTADPDAGQRTEQECAKQTEVDAAQIPVANAGDCGERHGVSDVAGHNAQGTKARIKKEEGGDAQRASANRRDGHQYAKNDTDQHRDGANVALDKRILMFTGVAQQFVPQEDRPGRQEQRKAQRHRHDLTDFLAVPRQLRQDVKCEARRRDATGAETANNLPVDMALAAVCHGATGLGQCRIEQIGAHRRGRRNAEQQNQQRRHERAATDPRHPDDESDKKARGGVQKIH